MLAKEKTTMPNISDIPVVKFSDVTLNRTLPGHKAITVTKSAQEYLH